MRLHEIIVGVPGAGKRTLLEAMAGLADVDFPAGLRLCVLDAERMDAPEQLALIDGLAARKGLQVLFLLNKADRISAYRTAVARTTALLRERGFPLAEIYPICALAARLFRLPADPAPDEATRAALGDFYFRYGPSENSLAAFSISGVPLNPLGSREVTAEQLRLALENTGVPALERRLGLLILAAAKRVGEQGARISEQGSRIKDQGSEISEQTPGTRHQAPGDAEKPPVAAHSVRHGTALGPLTEAPGASEQGSRIKDQGSGAETGDNGETPVGAANGRPPEAAACDDGKTPVGAANGRPPEAETSELEAPGVGGQAPGTRHQAPGDAPAAPADGRPAEASDEGEIVNSQLSTVHSAAPAPARELNEWAEELDLLRSELPELDELFQAEPPEENAPAEAGDAPVPEEAVTCSLEELVALAEHAGCAEILDLARAVQDRDDPLELREDAMNRLQSLYQVREVEELEALTADIEDLDLPALRALVDHINTGTYTVQTRTPYAGLVNARIDALQEEALRSLCAGVEEADSRELARIRTALERMDCAEVLKTDYFRRIETRQEALDVETLDRITAGAESMSEKELRTVAVTLEANNWNPKYVTKYRHRINLCREAAVAREIRAGMADLEDMERREVLELQSRLSVGDLPGRFTAAPLAQIQEKLYRMDMLRLMALNNDFDLLDFAGIDALRIQVARGDYCTRAKNTYLERLLEREKGLIIDNTDARAQLVRQLIGQNKLRMSDFDLASRAPTYAERLAAFWGGSGLEQPRDVPVFLLDNASQYAMTGERFYYKTGRDLAFLPLEDIERFQTMRQHMSLILQVVRKDSSYLLTGAKLSRGGAERTLTFLNECIRRWNEPGMTGAAPSNPIRTRRFEAADYTAPVETGCPDAALAMELFRARYSRDKLREGYLVRGEEDAQRCRRLLSSFGLPDTTPLVWYCSASLLGAVRDGTAIGPRAIYQKDSKLPVQIIPIEEIYSLTRNGRHVTLTTLQNQSIRLDLSPAMLPLAEDYVRTIQLGSYLRRQEEGQA